jgi:hypothetical protein
MLAALTACSADPSATYLARDPCAALVVNAADATPLELDGIAAAFALWRDRGVSAFDANPITANPITANPITANPITANPGGAISADAVATDAMPDAVSPIAIRFDDAAETFHGVYDPASATITINRALTDRATLAIVIAHELGHVFGLAHVPAATRASLMNPGNLATPPTDADQRTLETLWGTCRGAARGR